MRPPYSFSLFNAKLSNQVQADPLITEFDLELLPQLVALRLQHLPGNDKAPALLDFKLCLDALPKSPGTSIS